MPDTTRPTLDSTAQHVDEKGKPTKDFYNWMKSVSDFVTNSSRQGNVIAPDNIGTISSGTFTPDTTKSKYQFLTNNGAFTWAAPAKDCAIDFLVTNGASAGAITFSGYTVATGNTGDPLTTTNGHKFMLSVRRINSVSTFVTKALQ